MPVQFASGDCFKVDLIGAVSEAEGAGVGPGGCELKVTRDARSAMRLNGPVQNLESHVGSHDFDHGNLRFRGFIPNGIHHPGGFQDQQASLLYFYPGFRNIGTNCALFRQRFAKGNPGLYTAAHVFDRALGDPNEAHAVMDAARPQPTLGNFKSPALSEQQI